MNKKTLNKRKQRKLSEARKQRLWRLYGRSDDWEEPGRLTEFKGFAMPVFSNPQLVYDLRAIMLNNN